MKMAYKYYNDIALAKLVLFNLFRAFVAANLDMGVDGLRTNFRSLLGNIPWITWTFSGWWPHADRVYAFKGTTNALFRSRGEEFLPLFLSQTCNHHQFTYRMDKCYPSLFKQSP